MTLQRLRVEAGEAGMRLDQLLAARLPDLSRSRLRQLIDNHARYTGSDRARHILEHWETFLPKFRKVMPVEYRRALAELAAAGGAAVAAE